MICSIFTCFNAYAGFVAWYTLSVRSVSTNILHLLTMFTLWVVLRLSTIRKNFYPYRVSNLRRNCGSRDTSGGNCRMCHGDELGHSNRETSAAPVTPPIRVFQSPRKFLAVARIPHRPACFAFLSTFYSPQLRDLRGSACERHYQTRGIEIEAAGHDLLTSYAEISSAPFAPIYRHRFS